MAVDLVVSGATGRMGRALGRIAAAETEVRLVGGIARTRREPAEARAIGYDRIEPPDAAGPLIQAADGVIDVSAPDQLDRVLGRHGDRLAGRPLVVGTTGLADGTVRRLDGLADRGPVLVASNFSVGITLLTALVEEAARRLAPERFDVEVMEAHHRRKADAPSGTALALGEAVARARGEALEAIRRDGRSGRGGERPVGEIGFHAVRGGDVTGEHRVLFLGGNERLELAHAARDRALFAEGALLAARWLSGREAGAYTMRDVIGLPG